MADLNPQELLYTFGFLKDKSLSGKDTDERRKMYKEADDDKKKELLSSVDEETLETADGNFTTTGYPETHTTLRLIHEAPSMSLEDSYYWILEHLRHDRGFDEVIKIADLYASSEASAMWGNQQQRISAQQNQAQGLLANIGKFVREVFQMVREIRIIDERLEAYNNWYKKDKEGKVTKSESADVTLKSIFTDVVEQGTKNPQSVFGLAQTVGFTLLPDLFFNTRIYSVKELDKKIADMEYNESVKNVLRRKLYQFIIWKEKTHKELENRKKFNVNYLKQHWKIIEMYMNWVKPYLRNLKALKMREDLDDSPDLISSFDTNLSEVEFLATKRGGDPKKPKPCVLVNFKFRSRPEMSVRKEYQQGPSHMGRLEMTFRGYGWNQKQIDNYKEMRAKEDMQLLGMLDVHLKDVMDDLSLDFDKYIKDKVAEIPKEKKEEKKSLKEEIKDYGKAFEPFTAIFGGFWEIITLFVPMPKKKKKGSGGPSSGDFAKAAGSAGGAAFLTWHIYKKAHKMLTW